MCRALAIESSQHSRQATSVTESDAREIALLVGRAQSGHASSLDALLRGLQEPLFQHIASLTADDAIAEDVLQSALWTIVRKIVQVRDPRLFRAWAYRIATRLALRAVSQEREWRQAVRGDAMAELPSESHHGHSAADADEVRHFLTMVSGASGVVLRMYYLDQLSYLEIAEALDLPLGTVKSRIAYALAKLRAHAHTESER